MTTRKTATKAAPGGDPTGRAPEFEAREASIYERMAYVAAEVEAVAKRKRDGAGVPYPFRGIDDIMQALKEPMGTAELFVAPTVLEHTRTEYQSSGGTPMQRSLMSVRFTFYAPDGSLVNLVTVGEAADSSDKAANKAMTAALKYALLQAFLIPTAESDFGAERAESQAQASTRDTSQEGAASQQRRAGIHIGEAQAKKILWEAKERGDAIGMHGHELTNHVLSAANLETFQPRSKRDEVIEHLCRTVPRTSQWMDWFLEQIAHYSPPSTPEERQPEPAGPPAGAGEEPGGDEPGDPPDDLPF